jgi:hypothetical protein
MKRSRILLITLLLSFVLVLPAFGSAEAVSDGWTRNESSEKVAPAPDGWTWDEGFKADGWTWDEAASTPSG